MIKPTMPIRSPQEREAALFALALEKPAAERASFLQTICGTGTALRQRLDALLAASEEPDTLFSSDSDAARRRTVKLGITEEPPDEAVGQTLGRYKLLERIGEGRCGTVYVAEQTGPVRPTNSFRVNM